MDRVPYRRVTPSRNESTDNNSNHSIEIEDNEAAITRGEAIIMQCIIATVIFVIVLVASFTNITPAIAIRNGVQQVLSGAETLDELMLDIRRLGSEWFGWDAPDQPVLEDNFIPTENFREDWHNDIEQTVYPIPEEEDPEPEEDRQADEASNHTVPESSVTPGLWD